MKYEATKRIYRLTKRIMREWKEEAVIIRAEEKENNNGFVNVPYLLTGKILLEQSSQGG
jgi:hypothetical protein